MSTTQDQGCSYVRADGSRCSGTAVGDSGLCFWHDPDVSKEEPGVRERLQDWARTGESMEGFVLRYADLEGVRLADKRGLDLSKATLFRARLSGAHMWRVNLSGADLMKADLTGANLNEAQLRHVNLLGAVLDGTKLERVDWGGSAVQEQQAIQAEHEGDGTRAHLCYVEAEEVYRSLRRAYDSVGRFEEAGAFFRKEMTMRRKIMPRWSSMRIWSKLVDLFCGYGEHPQRVIGFSLLLVLCCACLFFALGVKDAHGLIRYSSTRSGVENLEDFLDCVYYSVVTFTTLGYGDIAPTGFARAIAALEAFSGAFMMALFVAVFGKKMTR